jgi:hypothetical protein
VDQKNKRLIQLDEHSTVWLSNWEIDDLMRKDKHFMDITDHKDLYTSTQEKVQGIDRNLEI